MVFVKITQILMAGFPVNIRINVNDIITLKQLCTSQTKIVTIKQIIINEQELNNINDIKLKYNNIFMDDNKMLSDYNIYDSKHIITLYFNVTGSNVRNKNTKKYSFFSDTNDGNNGFQNDNYNSSLWSMSVVDPLLKPPNNNCNNCCDNFKECLYDCYFIGECILPCCICIMVIGFVGLSIVSFIGLNAQRNAYREYSSSAFDTDRLNEICDNNASEFIRYTSNDAFIDAGDEFETASFRIMILLSMGIMYTCMEILCQECKACRVINCGPIIGFIVALGFMISINTNITFNIIPKIREYCDNNTDFYRVIITQWSVFNYVYTYVLFSLAPILSCMCCVSFIIVSNQGNDDGYRQLDM